MTRRILIGTALALLAQTILLGGIIANRAYILRQGETLILDARPVDPRDLLLGFYIGVQLPIEKFQSLEDERYSNLKREEIVYAVLEKEEGGGEGAWRVKSLVREQPPFSRQNPVLRGRFLYFDGTDYVVSYGIERYYLPEEDAEEVEKKLAEGGLQLEVAVLPSSGVAAIRRLLVDGLPKYEDPLFSGD